MKTNLKLADAYYRLSVEEANGGESSSITNQRSIVRQYCEDNGITIVKEFVDDGFSGSNFDRPGFSQMIAHLKDGLANMVITKDLSRLGRDMTESSYYAETYFPENQIHYIAISDNFDSNEVNIMAPFQFAMNDVYLRDTSRKIKQVINQKRTKGEYCACPPFGYMKNKDGTALEPDPKTAPIVQKIFAMAHDGKSARAIATALTENGAMSRISTNLSKLGLVIRGTYGEGSNVIGAMYQLSNQITLGLSEKEAVENLQNITMQLISEERKTRASLSKNINVQDKVGRSAGVLKNARLLSCDEYMKLISNVRFGIAEKLLSGITLEDIHTLTVAVQPATMAAAHGSNLSAGQRDILRADEVRKALKALQ